MMLIVNRHLRNSEGFHKRQKELTMQTATLNLNKTSLLELMQDFYILTGIRIVIFDSSYREILAWPTDRCSFCRLMHDHEISEKQCAESDHTDARS